MARGTWQTTGPGRGTWQVTGGAGGALLPVAAFTGAAVWAADGLLANLVAVVVAAVLALAVSAGGLWAAGALMRSAARQLCPPRRFIGGVEVPLRTAHPALAARPPRAVEGRRVVALPAADYVRVDHQDQATGRANRTTQNKPRSMREGPV